MPLVRCELRNEYGLGLPELYREASGEDPKAVLDGVSVSGLVGILRQLGDLAEFAAEVFHGLQEQVMTTASRSHKLMGRVQSIEVALPPLEKAILAQTSHLHFCYTAGSEWHPRIQTESNHFIYNDLPRFIMDSYEECRDPPRLNLLDKFDTGGPGACLKRYSDPTFFKRVSNICDEAFVDRQRNKKAHKRKQKRSNLKNREVSRYSSILNGSGRMQFSSPHEYNNTSPAQTIPYTDRTFKSDIGDNSTSLDSRTGGAGCIDCGFHLNSSRFETQEPNESPSLQLNLQNNDNLDFPYVDLTRVKEEDDFSCTSLQEQAAPYSSCVTWEEKTEIVKPEGKHCDNDVTSNLTPTDYCQNMPEVAIENVQSVSEGSQIDDIESETDNYVDALNTIESESENDLDCQTKREVDQCSSSFNNSVPEDELLRENMKCVSDHHVSDFESNTESASLLNREISMNGIPDPVSLERFTHDDFPQITSLVSTHENLPFNISGEHSNALDGSQTEVRNSFHESEESHAEISGVQTVQFWTNGGLLGLEPSKPLDCKLSNAASQNPVSESNITNSSSNNKVNARNDDLHNNGTFDQIQGLNLNGVKVTSTDKNQENDKMFGFGQRLLVNGFRRKLSLGHDDSLETHNSPKLRALEHQGKFRTSTNINTFLSTTFMEHSENGSSPPLELMKISFQPMRGFETSKLKLKIPYESHFEESNGDMFPSFQLVPEPSLRPRDVNSDSDDDDDTFSRSSSSISDDCTSHHSQSNSEQWESSESPSGEDHEIYGTLSRISSREFINGTTRIENRFESLFAENLVEPSNSCPIFDLPNFDTVNLSLLQEMTFDSDPKEPTPLPPPLPPLEWRVMKSHSDLTEAKQELVSGDQIDALSTFPLEQPKPGLIKHHEVIAEAAVPVQVPVQQKDQNKFNVKNGADQGVNEKRLDEQRDFLQQIRTKSFNLRPTLTAKPTIASTPATNVKVTAILEKAIAIRQAVGSDDDDTWSET